MAGVLPVCFQKQSKWQGFDPLNTRGTLQQQYWATVKTGTLRTLEEARVPEASLVSAKSWSTSVHARVSEPFCFSKDVVYACSYLAESFGLRWPQC